MAVFAFSYNAPSLARNQNTMLEYQRRIPFFFFAIVLFSTSLLAQTATPTPKITEDDTVIKVDSRLVVVPVTVTNANGDPVLGLTAKDFVVVEEGRKQT